ncbi:hypothetical protein ABL78_3534 [Leptomonas seymouri]|uniref:Uncharacterized protein n=1 Tax=Leptomonas seymouri TaxID=5684 RepID=A0A0N1ILA0_LEPSE|nr:hypothetical protein ABL78_3534 [Leptomonas seymouri]|eukprot:KPI87400.1 hypothetical protein ABL78_3534 [Leptomonas seymouri]
MRFPVSGCTSPDALVRSEGINLVELRAYVSSAEWRPSAAPVEVVWNANEAQPFHTITPASPEDVRLCTEYLLRAASENRSVSATPSPSSSSLSALTARKETGGASCDADRSRTLPLPRSTGAPDASPSDGANAGVCDTLAALAEVVCNHRNLLAGAESLQTGVPLTFLLEALAEAELYLRRSLQTHRPRSDAASIKKSGTVLGSPCGQPMNQRGSDRRTRAASAAEVDSVTCVGPAATTAAAVGTTVQRPPHESEMCSSSALQEEFDSEVACFHQQLRQRYARAVRKLSDSSEPRYSASAGFRSPLPEEHVTSPESSFATSELWPLITVVTPTYKGLAAALKAAAVAWAAVDRQPMHSGCVKQVLWRPAPETALAATWMMVLLRKHMQGQWTSRSVNANSERPVEETEFSCSTARLAEATRTADSPRDGDNAEQGMLQTETSPHQVPSPLHFNVLITGGDTDAHFVKPYVAAVATAQRVCEMMPDAPHSVGCNEGRSTRRMPTDSLSSQSESSACAPLLFCYGCPAAQLRELHSLFARQSHLLLPREAAGVSVVALRTVVPTTAVVTSGAAPTSSGAASEDNAVDGGECKLNQALSADAFTAPSPTPAGSTQCTQWRDEDTTAPADRRPPHPTSSSHATPSCHIIFSTPSLVLNDASYLATAGSASLLPCGDLADLANEVFRWGVVEPASMHSPGTNSLVRFTAAIGTAGAGTRRASSNSILFQSPSTISGWCSLCLVPHRHTAQLLRHLVQRHWQEPSYMGHSLDRSTRRGPVPSGAHAQKMRDALQCATKGVDARVTFASWLRTNAAAADAVGSVPPRRRENIRWRHVCGGFPLPLTAISSRASPYLLPCLLFIDLEAAMTEKEQHDLLLYSSIKGGERGEQQFHGADCSCAHANATSSSSALHFNSECAAAAAAAAARAQSECSATDELHSSVEKAVLHATQTIQSSVAALVGAYDTQQLGYRGVVGGNFLFLCRYPDFVEGAVQAAVRDGITA